MVGKALFSKSNIELFKRNDRHIAYDNDVPFYYWRGTGAGQDMI